MDRFRKASKHIERKLFYIYIYFSFGTETCPARSGLSVDRRSPGQVPRAGGKDPASAGPAVLSEPLAPLKARGTNSEWGFSGTLLGEFDTLLGRGLDACNLWVGPFWLEVALLGVGCK